MKHNINRAGLMTALITVLLLAGSCTKNNSGVAEIDNNRITPVLADNFNLSMFSFAVTRGYMNKKLEEEGPFTVLAPSDGAFSRPEFNFDLVKSDVAAITSLVRQHIMEGNVKLETLPYGFNHELTCMEGKLYATRMIRGSDTAITVNGARVLPSQISASNGHVQVIGRVLEPAAHAFLADAVIADENLSLFAHAMHVAGLLETLRENGPFTIFAPTNAAMQAQGYANIQQVNETDPETLRKFLSYHILRNRRFVTDFIMSADINDENVMEMMDGRQVNIKLIPDRSQPGGYAGITLKGTGNASDVYLEKENKVAGNGVLHTIQGVLVATP